MADILKRSIRLTVETLESRETPATGTWWSETFDGIQRVPATWSVRPLDAATIVHDEANSQFGALNLAKTGRAWDTETVPANFGVSADFRLESLTAAQLFVRGRNLETAAPTYYAATVSRAGIIRVIRVIDGTAVILGTIATAQWAPNQVVTLSLQPTNDVLAVRIRRANGDYLASSGSWRYLATNALTIRDNSILGDGQVGVSRPQGATGQLTIDNLAILSPSLPDAETFDDSLNVLPSGWSAWSSETAIVPRVVSFPDSSNGALAFDARSITGQRAWLNDVLPESIRVKASVLADTLIPAQLLLRGRDLNGLTPTYYAATIVRGAEIRISKIVGGQQTVLGRIKSKAYTSGMWLAVEFTAVGDALSVRVQRLDTGKWLSAGGDWQYSATSAIVVRDDSIRGTGRTGIARTPVYAGRIVFDDFSVRSGNEQARSPDVTATVFGTQPAPKPGAFAGVVRLEATLGLMSRITRVDFLVDGDLVSSRESLPFVHELETRNLANGRHSYRALVQDEFGNIGEGSTTFEVFNSDAPGLPVIPRHYSHIRVASLAYYGNPLGSFETTLLRDSIDLVVPNTRYLTQIENAASGTPQLIYSNISNLYLNLLTDWLAYADGTAIDREAAFYHVSAATPFTGDSASSMPVSWLWNVTRGPTQGTTNYKSLTSESRNATSGDLQFGSFGESLFIGYPEQFRELNLTLARSRTSAWSGVWEYPVEVDSKGRPTLWKSLTLNRDSTTIFRNSGQVIFDPPADWKAAIVTGSAARLYYVRVRTTVGTAAEGPFASRILGRDYVGANGNPMGTIPAFDVQADVNHDQYLSDQEYASRRSGANARFQYESRLFYPHYGQMRFVTNPSGQGVAAWATDYHRTLLASQPLADGVFVDNSGGRAPTAGIATIESISTYASDYASVLGSVNRGIAPKWVLANTAGGGADADRVVKQVPATIEEFAMRPLSSNWVQFLDVSSLVQRRLGLTDPSRYLVLDTLSTGGSPTDPRTRIAALAYYYLIADPNSTFLATWAGEEPASAWSRHWFDAIKFDVGQPKGNWTTFAKSQDPANVALSYSVFSREYDRALVLYKPLSYTSGKGTGGLSAETATTHLLNGRYRTLHSDGTLGPTIDRVSLRNGEGAILIRV